MADFYSAVICENGHTITSAKELGLGTSFCEQCGAPGVTHCPGCNTVLRGSYREGFSATYNPPSFCHACGAAFPWTARNLAAVRELADAIEELTDHERDQLAEFAPHIVQSTPRTEPAAFKVAAIISRMKSPGKKALYDLFVGLAVDSAKRVLTGT